MSFSAPSEKGMLISKVKRWINQAQAIPQNSTLSLQVLHDIQKVTGAKLCIGENPLTASSFFPSSWNSVTEKEGWMDKEDDWKSVLILLPTLQPSAQHNACDWISTNTIQHWFIVTNGATTIPSCLGSGICKIMDLDPEAPILRKHTGAFVRQQWESKPSKLTWSIWCSLQIPRETQHQIRSSLSSLSNRWTRRGVVQQMKDSPFYREAKFTEEGYLYEVAKYVAGSDGSVSQGDCMGYANVWLNASLPTSHGTPEGRPSSQTTELTGILADVSAPPQQEDVAVCTDSLSSLQLLTAMQRADFPQEIRTHANFNTLALIAQVINQRSESGGRTTLMKVTAHSGNPLNEWADEEATQAFSKAPQYEQCVPSTQFDCQYLLPRGHGPPFHIVWGTRTKRYATQQVAEMQLAKKIQSRGKHYTTKTEQFLCMDGQNRPFLGSWLSECKDQRIVRSVLMGCSEFYPCNAKLFQWKLKNSAECGLCHSPCETNFRIQCVCPSLEHSRVQAHHNVWGMTFS
jgi:ribonuclease HI